MWPGHASTTFCQVFFHQHLPGRWTGLDQESVCPVRSVVGPVVQAPTSGSAPPYREERKEADLRAAQRLEGTDTVLGLGSSRPRPQRVTRVKVDPPDSFHPGGSSHRPSASGGLSSDHRLWTRSWLPGVQSAVVMATQLHVRTCSGSEKTATARAAGGRWWYIQSAGAR